MAISAEKMDRVKQALIAFNAVREEFKDVFVVLDYATLLDVASATTDSDDIVRADARLSEDTLSAILWRLGKHVGGSEPSYALLPALIQFELDALERLDASQPVTPQDTPQVE